MIAIAAPRSLRGGPSATAGSLLVAMSVGVLAPLNVDLATATLHAISIVLFMTGFTMGIHFARRTK